MAIFAFISSIYQALLYWWHLITKDIFSSMIQKRKSLVFDERTKTKDIEKEISLSSSSLRSLRLFKRRSNDFNKIAIGALKTCPNLEVLELVDCSKTVSAELLSALEGKRIFLKLLGTTPIDPEILLRCLHQGCLDHLTGIDLGDDREPKLEMDVLETIGERCEELQDVNLFGFAPLDRGTFGNFVRRVSGTIRRIRVWGGTLPAGDGSYGVLSMCRRLEVLEIGAAGLGVQDLEVILGLESLKTLELGDVGLHGVISFAFGHRASSVVALSELRLSHLDVVNEDLISAVLLRCPLLEHLEVTCDVNQVEVEGMRRCYDACRRRRLRICINGEEHQFDESHEWIAVMVITVLGIWAAIHMYRN